MAEYRVEEFEYEEDYLIQAECDECGEVVDEDEYEDGMECPECGGELLQETSHEGEECAICGMRSICGTEHISTRMRMFSFAKTAMMNLHKKGRPFLYRNATGQRRKENGLDILQC